MFQIVKHDKAPLISDPESFRALLSEVRSSLSSSPRTARTRELLRQCGFVSLYFFLYYVAAFSGPFDKLNECLHLDMCNFRQMGLVPGARIAAFLPRSHYKSTIFTTGANAWELLRDPDLTVGLFNSKFERAQEFMHTTQRIFDSNKMFQWLYPEYVPKPNTKRWNDIEMVLPNRTKHKTEANLKCGSVGGTSEGSHYDLLVLDDIIGLKQLNANRQSSAEMHKTVNWFHSVGKTLLLEWDTSRIVVVGTRYAMDDVYESIMCSAYEFQGYTKDLKYAVKPEGEWSIYYRKAIEYDEVIFPAMITKKKLTQLMEDDPWTAMTQYFNDPQEAGMTELNLYKVHECTLDYDDVHGWVISYFLNGDMINVKLSDCSVVQACDPAGTEGYRSAKTSKSAVGIVAHAPDDKRFLIALNADYVSSPIMFDWMFSNALKFDGYLQSTVLETQGPFKILGPILQQAQNKRKDEAYRDKRPFAYLNLKSVSKTGEKDAVIRSALKPVLHDGLLYVEKSVKTKVLEELNSFPQSHKKDILDMLALAFKSTIRPLTEGERVRKKHYENRFNNRCANAAGY